MIPTWSGPDDDDLGGREPPCRPWLIVLVLCVLAAVVVLLAMR